MGRCSFYQTLLDQINQRTMRHDILINNEVLTRDNSICSYENDGGQDILDTNLTAIFKLI